MRRRGRPPHPDILTPREWEVLALLRDGLSNEAIAQRLGFTLAGAKYHVSEILSKLGVSSREEAAAWQPTERPWWLSAAAPVAALWGKVRLGWLPGAVTAGVAVVVAAGAGLLIWGLLRTSGDDPSLVTGQLTPTTVERACADKSPLSLEETQVFVYQTSDTPITISAVRADGAGSQQVICEVAGGSPAWSPSGRYIAYLGSGGSLRLLDVETGRDTVVDDGRDGTPGISLEWWSPADDLLAYQRFSDRRPIGIWAVAPETASTALVQTPDILRFTWSPEGSRIVYEIRGSPPGTSSASVTNELFLVNADGSGAHKLTDGSLVHHQPWSPDGRLLAYWNEDRGGSSTIGDIHIMELESGRAFSLGEFTSDEHPQWSPDRSRYVFHNLAIDPEAQTAASLFDRPGVILAWSPDGGKVAYVEGAAFGPPPRSLVVLDLESGERTTFHTSDIDTAHATGSGYHGEWSPHSRYYAFVALESESLGASSTLYVADTEAVTLERVLGEFDFVPPFTSYSPDGSLMLIERFHLQSPSIWMANADGSGLSKIADGVALRSGGAPWRPASD